MHWSLSSTIVLGLAVLSTSNPLVNRWGDVETRHAWPDIPKGWKFHKPASSDDILRLRIGLKQNRFDELVSSLYEVSDPKHERFGAHLTKQQVDELIAPHSVTLSHVEDWFKHHDIDISTAVTHSGGSSLLTIDVPVSKAERMLNTTYNVYHNPSEDTYVIRTMSYALPLILRDHVDVVMPTTYFGGMRRRATSFLQPDLNAAQNGVDKVEVDADCSTNLTPDCLGALYQTSKYVPSGNLSNSHAVVEFFDISPNKTDLQTFLKKYRKDAVGADFTVTTVNGGEYDQSLPNGIANLDTQYSVAMTYPINVTCFIAGGKPEFRSSKTTPINTNEPILDFLDYISNQQNIPPVMSLSYADEEQTVPFDYAKFVCQKATQLSTRGSTIIVPSGWDGVGQDECLTNDRKDNIRQFQTTFPAVCDHVTAVGGTTGIHPEVAVNNTGSGFSKHFRRPLYQKEAVDSYLKQLGDKYAGLYNSKNRLVPDVASQGGNLSYIYDGHVEKAAVCATVFASVITLLNDVRLSKGKSPLGFLNQMIYSSLSSGFTDITSGNNPGCNTDGFYATDGFDAISGWGTPNFEKLKELVEKLP